MHQIFFIYYFFLRELFFLVFFLAFFCVFGFLFFLFLSLRDNCLKLSSIRVFFVFTSRKYQIESLAKKVMTTCLCNGLLGGG